MRNKIEEFIRRSKYRNPHLYIDGLTEGYDYVVCPVSKARMSMIKSSYIERILGMTISEYDSLYPGIQKIANKRKENISQGLQQVDSTTGKTKYDLGQEKSRKILNTVDQNGVSGYKKKGEKTRATHMAKIDEMGRNGYRRQADFRLTTLLPNGMTVEQNAHKKQQAVLLAKGISRAVGASKISKKILQPIIDILDEQKLKYYFDQAEYVIKCPVTGNYYYYDLTIPKLKICIEYQSSAWHSNPEWDDVKWDLWVPPKGRRKTATESITYDYSKAKALYDQRGIATYYVWEDSSESNIEEILCLLKTQSMKS